MKRFLVVEDEEMSRTMLTDILSVYAPTDSAVNGEAGLRLFEQALSSGKPYSLVCVDLMMPVMNGLALVREIKKIEADNLSFGDGHTRVFVVTSNTCPWVKSELVLENLCDDYILKPYDRARIVTSLHFHYSEM